VVTTGTGSGKTQCFLLPLLADLARESASPQWQPCPPPPDPAARKWWNQGNNRAVGQWAHCARPHALRAIVLYPLNALVEDRRHLHHAVTDRRYPQRSLFAVRFGYPYPLHRLGSGGFEQRLTPTLPITGWTPAAAEIASYSAAIPDRPRFPAGRIATARFGDCGIGYGTLSKKVGPSPISWPPTRPLTGSFATILQMSMAGKCGPGGICRNPRRTSSSPTTPC
jgi:hypothetical protein